jgi:nucleotidyltransferase/DNA polymerase involved in DNA repair
VARIEKASVDECFIDFTQAVKEEILHRYPELSQPPTDSSLGLDTPLPPPPSILLEDFGTVVPINSVVEAPAEEPANGEGPSRSSPSPVPDLPPEDNLTKTWHDVALSIGAGLMQKCRDRIKNELGYTTSAVSLCSSFLVPRVLMLVTKGLARNKFLAKVPRFLLMVSGRSGLMSTSSWPLLRSVITRYGSSVQAFFMIYQLVYRAYCGMMPFRTIFDPYLSRR